MASKVEQNRAARSAEILEEAARLFAARGYHGTRLADIAAGLDLNKATLYHYFDSKEAILVDLVRGRVGLAVQSLQKIMAGSRPTPEKLERAVRSHIEVFQTHADLYTIFQSERLRSISVEAGKLVDQPGREYEDLMVGLISEGIEDGEFDENLDPVITMKAIVGMCNSTLSWFRPGGRLDVGELADRYAAMALSLVSPRPRR